MKETRFIAQNKEKWLESEKLLAEPVKDPEKLSNLFTQVVDDLSYSRTYYKNRSVRVYLNNIARDFFSIIYSTDKHRKNRFKLFWLDELPQIIIYCRKQLIISLLVFLLAGAIGIFSSMKDPQFAGTILGEGYVAMTKENIKKGDPMAVYKSGHQVDMFLGITINNLMVAFRTYVFGVFMAIGTLAILLYNGIMVGCFQFFFAEHGLLARSALSIWLHGTLEISSIVLSGGAGLVLGSGLLFPGTYSRLQAFQISASRSLKLMLGISPIFVLAGLIESFLTRYTDAPDFLKLMLIVLSAVLIVGYFVVYPWMKSRTGFEVPLAEIRLTPTAVEPAQFDRIKSNGEILKDAFMFYKKNGNILLSWTWVVSLCMAAAHLLVTSVEETERYGGQWFNYLLSQVAFAARTPSPVFILINAVGTGLVVYRVFWMIDGDAKRLKGLQPDPRSIIQVMLLMGGMYGLLYWLDGWGAAMLMFCFGFLFLAGYVQQAEGNLLPFALGRSWKFINFNFGQVMGLQLILVLTGFSFLLILYAPLLYFNITILKWNFAKSDIWSRSVVRFIDILIRVLGFNLVVPIFAASIAYLYSSLLEVLSANHLMEAIARVGTRLTKMGRK